MAHADQLKRLPVAFTHAQARQAGLTDRDLRALEQQEVIEKLGRGVYRYDDFDQDPNLMELALRAPNATLCLTSALARHGLTDEIPSAIDVALPRPQRQPATSAPVRWHRFDENTFELGRLQLPIGSLRLFIYSPERTICDAFRLRHIYSHEEAVEALKRWIRHRGSTPSALLRMARSFGPQAETPIRETLQVLL